MRGLSLGFVLAALIAIAGAVATILTINLALARFPELLRLCLGTCVALFPIYAAIRVWKATASLDLTLRARGLLGVAILMVGHGSFVLVAMRMAQ